MARRPNNKLYMVLWDWEKTFDEINREGLFLAMKRVNVPNKIIGVVKSLYHETNFFIERNGYQSDFCRQAAGIRQGCPLSPYLFLIAMTALFHDVRTIVGLNNNPTSYSKHNA